MVTLATTSFVSPNLPKIVSVLTNFKSNPTKETNCDSKSLPSTQKGQKKHTDKTNQQILQINSNNESRSKKHKSVFFLKKKRKEKKGV